MSVRRQIIEIDGRRNHLRYAGSGPPVLLLHQSPQTSATQLTLMEELAPNYLVIAPDTPGFGLSDLLPQDQPRIADFADNLQRVLEALGIRQALVMGVHTGAQIAMALADQHPDAVAHMVLDGVPAFDQLEQAHILSGYFEPNPPRWDGSHLIRLWGKIAEQTIFFPWFDQRPAARMTLNQAPPEVWDGYIHDYLYAGEDYKIGYGAAFSWDAIPVAERINRPCHILFRAGDPLENTADRLSGVPEGVSIESIDMNPAVVRARVREIFDQVTAGPALAAVDPTPCRVDSFVDDAFGQWRVRQFGDADQSLLLLHDLGSSGDGAVEFADELQQAGGNAYRVVLPDLPFHGETGPLAGAAYDLEAIARAVYERFVDDHCLGLVALGGAAAIAAHVQKLTPALPVTLHQPLCPEGVKLDAARWWPLLPMDECGAHLLHRWRQLRYAHLFFPWYDNTANGAVRSTRPPDPESLQQQLFDALRCGEHATGLWRAAIESDLSSLLGEAKLTTGIEGRPESNAALRLQTVSDLKAAASVHADAALELLRVNE
ncbi:MAG: alpha/beta fold hydrolase [Pseudomonadota bacterium]